MPYRERVETFIHNDKGQILAGKRKFDNGREKIVFPGGGVDPGEDVVAAGLREAMEEAGVKFNKAFIPRKSHNMRGRFDKDGETFSGSRTHFLAGAFDEKDKSLFGDANDAIKNLKFMDINTLDDHLNVAYANEPRKYRGVNKARIEALRKVKKKMIQSGILEQEMKKSSSMVPFHETTFHHAELTEEAKKIKEMRDQNTLAGTLTGGLLGAAAPLLIGPENIKAVTKIPYQDKVKHHLFMAGIGGAIGGLLGNIAGQEVSEAAVRNTFGDDIVDEIDRERESMNILDKVR